MGEYLLKLHVTPRSSRDQVIGWRGDVLCVKTTAPPVEGAANGAISKFLARSLGVRTSQITLVSGEKSREKTFRIRGISEPDVRARLSAGG